MAETRKTITGKDFAIMTGDGHLVAAQQSVDVSIKAKTQEFTAMDMDGIEVTHLGYEWELKVDGTSILGDLGLGKIQESVMNGTKLTAKFLDVTGTKMLEGTFTVPEIGYKGSSEDLSTYSFTCKGEGVLKETPLAEKKSVVADKTK